VCVHTGNESGREQFQKFRQVMTADVGRAVAMVKEFGAHSEGWSRQWGRHIQTSHVQVRVKCWNPGLPNGDLAVVFGTKATSLKAAESVQHLLSAFPGTNAHIHIYHRSKLSQHLVLGSALEKHNLNCDVKLFHHILEPNRGNEAAVYLAYIVEHYHNLPEMIVFIHDHGGQSWHSENVIFLRRLHAFYRGIFYEKYMSMRKHEMGIHNFYSRFSSKMRTLSSCYHEGPGTRSPFCIRHVPKRFLLDDPDAWRQAFDKFDGILKEYGVMDLSDDQGKFWSCCASFIARRQHIHNQPLEFYNKSLEAILQMDIPAAVSGRWWEYNWYRILGLQDQPIADIQDYLRIDGLEWPSDKHLDGLLTGRPIIL
jgi:hypothetical protein